MEPKKALTFLLILCFAVVSISKAGIVIAEPKTLVVPDDYASIKEAIDVASDGDTVFVKKGTYDIPENQTLVINKTISLIGEDAENTKIHLHPPIIVTTIFTQTFSNYDYPILINANNVEISGFTITSDGGELRINGNNTQIVGNIITTYSSVNGFNQTIALNVLTKTLNLQCFQSIIYQNLAVNCSIAVNHGSKVTVFNNTCIGGSMGAAGSSNYILVYRNAIKNGIGIRVASYGSIMANNTVTNCDFGVTIAWGEVNSVIGNIITNCQIGLESRGGFGFFHANYVANNSIGANIQSQSTLYDNNFINNIKQVNTDPDVKYHHMGLFNNKTEGNFWSDYSGEDSNGDGVGDTPYCIDDSRADNYPLMFPFNNYNITAELPEWATNQMSNLNSYPNITFPANWEKSIPEFPSWTILPLILTATVFLIIVKRKLHDAKVS